MLKNVSASHRVYAGAEGLLSCATASLAEQVVLESVRAGIFDALERGPVPASALAGQLHCSCDALARVLRVLVEMGLVSNQGGRYANTAAAARFLCRSGGACLGDFFIHNESLRQQWRQLGACLRTGAMAAPGEERLADYPRQLEMFLRAMHAAALVRCDSIRKQLQVRKFSTMLDLGGGMGTYAVDFAAHNRRLQATVADLKDVVPHAQEYIGRAGMQERVRAVACQCLEEPLPPGPYELVFISNMLHVYDGRDCRKVLKKAAGVLSGGGVMVVHDYMPGCGDGLAAALFDMTMLTGTPQGRCHCRADVEHWLESAGIEGLKAAAVPAGTAIVWGMKNSR